MPWASNATLRSDDTVLQRGTKMRAIGIQSVNLVIDLDQENFPTFNALDLCFLLTQVLQIRQSSDILEFEFLSHSDRSY